MAVMIDTMSGMTGAIAHQGGSTMTATACITSNNNHHHRTHHGRHSNITITSSHLPQAPPTTTRHSSTHPTSTHHDTISITSTNRQSHHSRHMG